MSSDADNTDDNNSLEKHQKYCSTIDKISMDRFGCHAWEITGDERLAYKIIQDGWTNDTSPLEVVNALSENSKSRR